MKLTKSPPELIAAFDAALPPPPVERRVMFGYPAAFIGGNLFFSLFADSMVLRLPEEERKKLLAVEGARPFEPMPGRVMKDYVRVPPSVAGAPKKLKLWIEKALKYAQGMPAKVRKSKKISNR
jgi:TfoX/Sxy family transcriptional regulator of competence genes